MKFTKILLPLFSCACLLFAACGKGGNTNNSGNTNAAANTSNKTANTVTASPAPTVATTASPANDGARGGKVATPEDAAEGLFNAWKAKDRAAASRFASDIAIKSLFESGGGAEGLQSQGCDKQGDEYLCGYSYEGGGLLMTVAGNDADGYKVTGTSFIAD